MSSQEVEAAGAEADEERADDEADGAAPFPGGTHEDREAEHDREEPEESHRAAIDPVHRQTEISSFRSFPPFTVCSSTVPTPRT